MDTVLLIDFNCFMWKGVVKFGNDEQSNYFVVYNFFRNLRTLINEFNPRRIFLCGEGGKTFRHELYGDYKANRIIKTAETKSKQDHTKIYKQADIIWKLCGLLPLIRVFAPGYEADDVIATMVKLLSTEDTIIVSNDKDFIQLLQSEYNNLSVYDPFAKDFISAPEYHQTTFLILNGDVADNIPSLLGKKSAIELASDPAKLTKYLSLEENRANYSLNKQLVELRIIPDIELQILNYELNDELLWKEFEQMDFKSYLSDKQDFKQTYSQLS